MLARRRAPHRPGRAGHPAAAHAVSFGAPLFLLRAARWCRWPWPLRARPTAGAGARAEPSPRRALMPSVAPLRPGLSPAPADAPLRAWRWPPSRSRWPGRRPRSRCPRSVPRSCSSPTSRARWRHATSSPRASRQCGAPRSTSSTRARASCASARSPSTTRCGRSSRRAPTAPTRARCSTGLRPSGGTATGEGLAAALGLLRRDGERERRRPPAAVILLSDGASTHGRDPIAVAREAVRGCASPSTPWRSAPTRARSRWSGRDGATVTRAVPPDRDTMRRIATISGGRTFSADDGRRARHRLRAARLAGGDARGAARGHRRLRRRRGGAAAGRRRALAALVRPAAVSCLSCVG